MVKKIVFIFLILLTVVAVLNLDRIKQYFGKEPRSINQQEVKLIFRTDPTLTELSHELVANGVVAEESDVVNIVKEKKIDTTQFAAGKYVILSGTVLSNLIDGFTKNEEGQGKAEVKVNVVFNRCRDIYDIGSNISKCIIADSASIVDYILSDEALNQYHFTEEQVPALFLPDSYEMYFDTDAKGFVAQMAAVFTEFWNEDRKVKMNTIGLKSPSQVATLASIVYSEQGKVDEEWPVIASLYLNRLKKGMKLQSDPTFKFCWGRQLDGVQRLLNKHRDIQCAYNTYLHEGLPPGPIFITPAKVIDAVLSPANTNYIFMCAKPDYSGGHNFTDSGREHENNAAVYRRWLANELRN